MYHQQEEILEGQRRDGCRNRIFLPTTSIEKNEKEEKRRRQNLFRSTGSQYEEL